MRAVVLGGKLQGVEAVYLAHQAGWEVTLVDRNPQAPAVGLCDSYRRLDILRDAEALTEVLRGADLIIPALEDERALTFLAELAAAQEYPLAFDPAAYDVSSSKRKSDLLFRQNGIPAPRYWPGCGFPLIAKPSALSGSRGVRLIADQRELDEFFKETGPGGGDYILQEFLEGDSYSLEVIGLKEKFLPLLVTELEMDDDFDCKRVSAPVKLDPVLVRQFAEMAEKVAGLLDLTGVMDLEVILHQGVLKLLEIDARLPSQTPTAVYKATGVNIVELLYRVFSLGELPREVDLSVKSGVVYEHIRVSPEGVETLGEHIISDAGPLRLVRDFYGADEALTNFEPGRAEWVATLIVTGADRDKAWERRSEVLAAIGKRFSR
ncbi:MAG: 3-methylornithine--L-lysine ligase [Clostridia bacterium]|nr:3-methylornithine--L-lysine ligase [Clostridia bacterium]MDN5365525.1 3-methylornithine--L-lysine ligase [Thermacetogenium sp.]MDN5375094.1 3-methylornithine--L-lysine ligase [Thermacetogenium sp.]